MRRIYVNKMTKRTLRVLPVVFLSMVCLMLIVFGCMQAIRENGRVKVGVTISKDDSMAMALVNTVQNMDELSSFCDFSIMTEDEGRERLGQGEISALIVVPEEILQKIYRNDRTSIDIHVPGKPTLDSALLREFAEAGASLVLTAKAGDFTAYNLYQKYGRAGSMKEIATDMNGNYIQFVIQQKALFRDIPVAGVDGIADEDRMFLAGIVLILFLLMIPLLGLQKREPDILSLQLARSGVGPVFSLLINGVLFTFLLFSVLLSGAAVLFGIMGLQGVTGQFATCLFPGCVMTAALFLFLNASGQSTAGSILFVFFGSLAQIFLAGGLFPVTVLPEFCVKIGNVLPGGVLIRLLHMGISGIQWDGAVLFVFVYIFLFFAAALWITGGKRRRGA